MFTWTFWKDALERAAKTAAQAALITLSGAALDAIDYREAGVAIAGMVLASLLTSIVSSQVGSSSSASMVGAGGGEQA